MSTPRLYRITFVNQGASPASGTGAGSSGGPQVYEIYARSVSHGSMMGFVEIEKIVFGERSSILVDPGEERLKAEFENVIRTYVPIHSIIRIDQVDKVGAARITSGEAGSSKVMPFPGTSGDFTRGGDHKK